MKSNGTYSNPNSYNNIVNLQQAVDVQLRTGRKSISKKKETMQKVHGNNGNNNLKDNYFGF